LPTFIYILPGAEDKAMNKAAPVLALIVVTFYWGETVNKQ
jgi:hypothetical protein